MNQTNYNETSKVLSRLIRLCIRKPFYYLDGNNNLMAAFFEEFGTYVNDEFINKINKDVVVLRYTQLLKV